MPNPHLPTTTSRHLPWSALLLLTLAGCGAEPPRREEPVASSSHALADATSPVGTWYLNANGARLELQLQTAGSSFSGTIKDEGGGASALTDISWDAANRWLEFRRSGSGFTQWYRLSLVQGVVSGRFSHSVAPGRPALTSFSFHATGWSPNHLDTATSPRTWNVTLNAHYKGVLRIDTNVSGQTVGTLKVFDDTSAPGSQEELEYQLSNIAWNGNTLSFTRSNGAFSQTFNGTVSGRGISGTFSQNGAGAFAWNGVRGEVLGFGLGSRIAQRVAWRAQTRARLANLTEGMRLIDAAEPAATVTTLSTGGPNVGGAVPTERDDDLNSFPADYSLTRLTFSVAPGNRFDPAHPAPSRSFSAILAKPNAAPPSGGFRAVVAVNGHGGSAEAVMQKSDEFFWHGDSAARQNLVVLAIDVGHRAEWNTPPVTHPAIIGTGYTSSNWEEDGERAFNVRRGVDYLMAQPFVRSDRIFIEGLSMGGEVTTIGAAMDPRISFAIAAGYSPDMNVMDTHGNHPCYRWSRADIHEYLDISDYEGLIAPRALVVETGAADFTFSSLSAPFAADKQVIRRARIAYGPDAGQLIHYLHYDTHHFHVGGFNPTNPSRPQGVLTPSATSPASTADLSWQTSASTSSRSPTLYQLMDELMP